MVNLIEAIIQKNTQKVKSILEQGDDPNSVIDASELRKKWKRVHFFDEHFVMACKQWFRVMINWLWMHIKRTQGFVKDCYGAWSGAIHFDADSLFGDLYRQ